MIIAIWRNLWRLSVGKRSSSSFTFSFRYYKDIVNLFLNTLSTYGYANPKWYCQLVEDFRVYLQAKNQFHPHFWRYCKDMLTYFEYFGHAWLHTLKMIVSMFICMPKINLSFTSFLRYYISKNPVIWLADSILAHNSRTISFQFRLFPRKTNDSIFRKNQKNLFWGHFESFLSKFGQKWIFLKKMAVSF